MMCDKIIADKNCNTIVLNEEFDSNFVYIYILLLNKHNGETISLTFVRTRIEEDIVFTIKLDGYYTLCRIRIPKDELSPYYYKDGKIYKNIREVSLLEVLLVNPEVSKVLITYFYYFQLCCLRLSYVLIASKIIDNAASTRCSTKVNTTDIYRRDLLWSAINVISYLAEMEQFEEAERMLERISDCNGLYSNNCGCGCCEN